MERFIRRENIKRFRKLLLEAKDDAERRRIQKLLIEEEQKESAAGTPSPSTARISDAPSRRLPALTANGSETAQPVRKSVSRRG
jgi:activator of HSP90 ATPase